MRVYGLDFHEQQHVSKQQQEAPSPFWRRFLLAWMIIGNIFMSEVFPFVWSPFVELFPGSPVWVMMGITGV